ncbi:hypothetical protein GGR50DRAFT_485225 [Xylaria sp. CBS 124048]|nr:hypothetical protein GGR50DRAFT_485225 [Xylaria sp. CBS 124048]
MPDAPQPQSKPVEQSEQQQSQTSSTMEWAKEKYNEQYEAWMPWIEDTFLKYFTKDNRTSYATREQLDKTKVTGVSQVDALQDNVNDLAASQVGQGGLLQPVGDVTSEGMKRSSYPQENTRSSNSSDNSKKPLNVPSIPNVPSLGL